MKQFLLAFTVFTSLLKAQTCGNLNFEAGNLGGWNITNGFNTNTTTMAGCCTTAGGSAVIINTPFNTPYLGTLPHSPFGGTKVAMVGDSILNKFATKMTYSFVVAGNTLQYAIAQVALNPANHICSSQSYQLVVLKDNSGAIFYTNQMVPATNTGTCTVGGSVFTNTATNMNTYGCWSTYSINIGAYISQTISVEVSAVNCTGAGHWIYSFFDAVCSAITPTLSACSLTTGLKENKISSNEISLWPNPAKDILNIQINDISNCEIIIYDVIGNVVLDKKELQAENVISIKNLNQGLYFYTVVKNNKSVKTGKIIKE